MSFILIESDIRISYVLINNDYSHRKTPIPSCAIYEEVLPEQTSERV